MTRQRKPDRIAEELSAIPAFSRHELLERWESVHGNLPPKGLSRRLLEYSAAYQIQVKAFGGMKPATRRQLLRHITMKAKPARSGQLSLQLKAISSGTRLVREWHGVTHAVEVLEKGFLYDGETYKSLSKVANVITGARWSGPRFFGL